MNKKVVVSRYEINNLSVKPVKEKVDIISESIDQIYKNEKNIHSMKKLINLERIISKNPNIHYELSLEEEDELTIENFNRELAGKEVIHKSFSFNTFLICYAKKIQSMANYNTSFTIRTIEDVEIMTSTLALKLQRDKKR